jgi:hypothetical protein
VAYEIIKSNDFSIYHATNIAVSHVKTHYYAVAGADDRFDKNFISYFYKLLESDEFDLAFGAVESNGKITLPGTNLGWLYGMHGVASSHSIGSIIKTSLHEKFGLYSKMFPVVADQYFIKQCVQNESKTLRTKKIFGSYANTGFSSTNKFHYQLDFFKMQVLTEKSFAIQFLIFMLRLVKLKFNGGYK